MGRAGKHRKAKEAKGIAPPSAKKNKFEIENDEDIDDDIAFDSEDEAKYGHFFTKAEDRERDAAQSAGKKGKKGSKDLDAFDELYDDDDDDDDDGDGFDLSDLLDSTDDKKKKKTKKSSASAVEKVPKAKRASARNAVTREEETLFGEVTSENRATASAPLKKLVKEAATASKKGSKAAKRLEAAAAKNSLVFAEDIDPDEKLAADRALTRDDVAERGEKWKPVLRELKKAKHVNFPLKGAEESAVPTTLGGITSVADPAISAVKASKKAAKRTRENADNESAEVPSEEKKGDPKAMAAQMASLLVASGLSSQVKANANDGAHAAKAVAGFKSRDGQFVDLNANDNAEAAREGDEGHEAEPVQMNYVKKLKAMMSYEIAKRRRLNSIKSKTYRRILRKEKEREAEKKQRALEILNPAAAKKRLQTKMEKMRAVERATQKHKNTSKWVKHVKKFSKFDTGAKEAIDDQYREHARLMQKMDEDADNELQEAAEESEEEMDERKVDELLKADPHSLQKTGLKSVLWGDDDNAAEEELPYDPADPSSKARHELRQMGFMQKAKERQEKQMEEELKDLQEDVARYHAGQQPLHAKAGDFDAAQDEDAAELAKEDDRAARISLKGHSVLTRGQSAKDRKAAAKAAELAAAAEAEARERQNATTGRKKFGAAATEGRPETLADLSALKGKGMISQRLTEDSDEEGEDFDEEEELSETFGTEEEEEIVESDDDDEDDAPAPTTEGTARRKAEKKTSNVLGGDSAIPEKKKKKKVTVEEPRKSRVAGASEIADPTANPAFDFGGDGDDAQQDYLVSRAFAADEVDEDFLKLKEQQVETIMKPKDPNESLPGWGEWGGEDEQLNAKHKERTEKSELQRRVEKSCLMSARVDSKMSNVIVNHEVDLVPTAYSLKMVPRPFANATEFHRSMRQPKGPEWNTATTYRDGVAPRLQTKQGAIIEPLSKETGKRKAAKTEMRKRGREGDEKL